MPQFFAITIVVIALSACVILIMLMRSIGNQRRERPVIADLINKEGQSLVVLVHGMTLAHSEGVLFAALAEREGVSRSYFTRLVRLSYLAPDITQAILDGRQPRDLTAEKLLAHSRLPLAWHDQRTVLGFA
jgi:hypothetical protein